MPERACKAGALPAELHAHAAETTAILSEQLEVPAIFLNSSNLSVPAHSVHHWGILRAGS